MTVPMMVALYARFPIGEKSNDMQLGELHAYAARMGWSATEYVEKESSVKKRPIFEKMLGDARAGKVKAIVVWSIDRFARSMKDYVFVMLDLYRQRIRLISITENVDTDAENPISETHRGLLALLAQLDRKIITAHVNAGVAESRRHYAAGRVGKDKHSKSGKDLPHGRPKKIFRRDEVFRLRAQKPPMSLRKIAAQLGLSLGAVARCLESVPKTS
jgi:DNA invertase Pin-like site-specific DNA recombinase